ncbi:MAG: TonB-dependent receptor [Sulfurimonas sp.]
MRYKIPVLSLIAISSLYASPLSVEKIVVNSSAYEDDGSMFMGEDAKNKKDAKQTFTQKSLSTLSTQANMNPYTVIQFSPSVNFTPVDQTGSNEPAYHDPIRIRGKSQTGPGGVYMINGTPISSNPGGGKQMIDLENVASVDLHKGYLSVDKNLGFSSLIGKIDLNVLAPKKRAGAHLGQTFGSNNFGKTFVRFDSGKVGDVRVFGSFSALKNDKTKGEGDQQRFNAMLGLAYKPNERFSSELYVIKNSDEHHNYASLSYAEAKDLDSYYSKDFSETKPTTQSNNYYDWNKQDFDTTAVVADLKFKAGKDDTIVLKPYYKTDKGEYWFSKTKNSTPMVMNWQMDHDLYGAVASYEHKFGEAVKAKVGYWYHKQLPPGPPTDQKKYGVDTNGNLVYKGYGILADTSHHTLQSPFLELSGDKETFHYSVGLQYQTFTIASIKSYTGTSGATSMDHDTAITQATLDRNASVSEKEFNTFIPALYLAYDLNPTDTIYIDYSRTYGFDVNLFPTYASNRAAFVAQGITLQSLWNDLELETSDNIDLGARMQAGAITLNPSIFVSFVNNKQANIYANGVNYPANVGKALGYGAEFAANGPINENLEFIASLSYNRYSFTEDFQTATGTTDIKGNQLPDAPKFMAKGALSYTLNDWTFTPSVRYTSSRYGDAANTEEIPAFTLVDLDVAYKIPQMLGSKNALFRLTATNLTNEKYIATIIAADNALAADGTASTYQTGAPFGIYASLNLKY